MYISKLILFPNLSSMKHDKKIHIHTQTCKNGMNSILQSLLHLLSLDAGSGCSTGEGGEVRSSKLIMYRHMSSTSLFTGAMTSLHRNFDPVKTETNYY